MSGLLQRAKRLPSVAGAAGGGAVARGPGGCIVDRRPLSGGPSPADDAFAGLDASSADPDAEIVDGVDAALEPPDAAAAVDAGPLDGGPCDFAGDMCCGASCARGLRCLGNGVCDVELCGTTAGGPCCMDGTCPGSLNVCVGGTCQACGGRGEPCCTAMSCDDATADACDRVTCVSCGSPGEPCCAAGPACDGPAVCGGDGRCQLPEGTRGGPCRDIWTNPRCEAWSQCNGSSICEGCGLAGEGCCGIGECRSPATCDILDGFRCR
jgi:hypothetical protein